VSDWEKFVGRPRLGRCPHRSTVSTVTAGLERRVCENCGNVSVRYVAQAVKIFPDTSDLTSGRTRHGVSEPGGAGGRQATCEACGSPAKFKIPRGLACPEHAWEAASRQGSAGYELWIPIRIDQNANTTGW
jgi:hypothetical protein